MAGSRHRRRALWLGGPIRGGLEPAAPWLGGLVLTACLPGAPPESLLAEEPEVIGLRMEVVELGPHTVDLLPIPADRTRSEALPGDRVRITPLVANVDGIIDLEELDPRWMIGRFFDLAALDSLPPCDPARPLDDDEACAAGSGAPLEYVVHDLHPTQRPQPMRVFLVVGIGIPTTECLELLSSERETPTWDCVIATRLVNLGPAPLVARLAIDQGIPLTDDGTEPELPDEPIRVAPDFAPEVSSIVLSRPGDVRRIWAGDRTSLPAGTTFRVGHPLDPRDSQSFIDLSYDGTLRSRRERLWSRWHSTLPVFQRDGQLLVPDAGESFTVVLVASDTRTSQTWSIFEFDAVAP